MSHRITVGIKCLPPTLLEMGESRIVKYEILATGNFRKNDKKPSLKVDVTPEQTQSHLIPTVIL